MVEGAIARSACEAGRREILAWLRIGDLRLNDALDQQAVAELRGRH